MNNGFNNQYNNFGYNLLNDRKQSYHNRTIVNNNPHAHKSDFQVEKEIDMLEKKIENNKAKLNNVSDNIKIMIENIIAEDEIRINDLNMNLLPEVQ